MADSAGGFCNGFRLSAADFLEMITEWLVETGNAKWLRPEKYAHFRTKEIPRPECNNNITVDVHSTTFILTAGSSTFHKKSETEQKVDNENHHNKEQPRENSAKKGKQLDEDNESNSQPESEGEEEEDKTDGKVTFWELRFRKKSSKKDNSQKQCEGFEVWCSY